jgi:hypothetical protein
MTRSAELRHGEQVRQPGDVASPSQLPTIAANAAACPVELQFSAISKGLLMATAAVPDIIHVARLARSMYSLSQSRSGSCRFAE